MSRNIIPNPTDAQETLVLLKKMPTGGGSDRTLKKDIRNLPASLKRVMKLRPVVWHWKDEKVGENQEYGFIAQEVEKIMPDLVSIDTWVDGTERKFLSSQKMVPFLVAAIQEQQVEIDKLRAEIESQKQ